MDDTVLPSEWLFRLKAATRDLVSRAGGVVRAAAVTGYGKSSVARWGSTDHADIIPLAAAMLLQRETESDVVTEAMAELRGRSLGPKDGGVPIDNFMGAFVRLTRSHADVSAAIVAAAADGVITPNEQAEIDRRLADEAEALAAQRSTLDGTTAIPLRAGRTR